MKIVAISDTHNQLHKITVPDGDVLIHAGDFGAAGNMEEWKRFLHDFSKLPHKHKLATFGNHDVRNSSWLPMIKAEALYLGIHILVDEAIKIKGVKFYMSPWVPQYGMWFWMRHRGEHIGRKWDNIPDDTDVLVTHGPPHGILDMSPYDHVHAGCEELRKRVDLMPKLKAHIFGHIHDGYGIVQMGQTMFYNVAVCNERYTPDNPPTVINL
jgi:Icc-related predicted phosphoesterase